MKSGPSSDQSDISQDFRLADILGVPQAIKGFDKSDFCEVFSIYLQVVIPSDIDKMYPKSITL